MNLKSVELIKKYIELVVIFRVLKYDMVIVLVEDNEIRI